MSTEPALSWKKILLLFLCLAASPCEAEEKIPEYPYPEYKAPSHSGYFCVKTTSEINAGDELTTENTAEFETNKRNRGKNKTGVLLYSDHPKATRILKTGTILTGTDFKYFPVPVEVQVPAWTPAPVRVQADIETSPRPTRNTPFLNYRQFGDFDATRFKRIYQPKALPIHAQE